MAWQLRRSSSGYNLSVSEQVPSAGRRLNHVVFLALGSNLGERIANLRAGLEALAPEVRVVHQSKIYETPPWGFEDQRAFLNMAVQVETDLDPDELLNFLKRIEVRLGREPSFRWGPRLIDIDILFYDDLVRDSPQVSIPHPRLHERAFVLLPLAEIAPDLVHPVFKKRVLELLDEVDRTGIKPI